MNPRNLAGICACLLLLVSSLRPVTSQAGGEAGGDANGEAESSVHRGVSPITARNTVCQRTADAYNGEDPTLYREWLNKISDYMDSSYYFTSKPQTVPVDSVCYGMNTTCCKPTAEKEILRIANREYGLLFQETLDESLQECPHIGRKLYSALYKSFDEIRRQFEIDMNEVLNDQLPADMFDHFFQYFNLFIFHPDLCMLEDHLQLQIQRVADFVYRTIHRGPDIDVQKYPCFVNITRSLTSTYLQDLFTALETQLYKIRVLVQSVQVTEEIVGVLRRHTFSPACLNALIRLKHCSYCGGFKQFKPCLYFCVNTLQGCFADVAELRPAFNGLLSSLKMASGRFSSQLQPEAFIQNALHHFVAMARSLKSRDLKGLMSTECVTFEHSVSKRQLLVTDLETDLRPVELPEDALSYDVFSTAMLQELDCMEELSSLLWNVPQEMCFLSKHHIASIGNEQCWTGTDMGSYNQQPLGKLKQHQVNNTAFSILPLETAILYNAEIAKLHQVTNDLNATILQDDPCLQSDDEDCSTRPVYACDDNDRSGSGSGSGSGFMGTSGFEDMEGETTPSSKRPGAPIDDLNDPSLEDFDDIWMENADNSRPTQHTETDAIPTESVVDSKDEEEKSATVTKSKDGTPAIEILKSTMPEVTTTETPPSSGKAMLGSVTVLLVYCTAVAALAVAV